jgi:hypothetical protein
MTIMQLLPYMKVLPTNCPSCQNHLVVKRLRCESCETEVEGLYPPPPLASVPQEDQEFILQFIKVSGSLKDMAKLLGVSYPTVRNRLDEVIERLKEIAPLGKEAV